MTSRVKSKQWERDEGMEEAGGWRDEGMWTKEARLEQRQ